jgi:lipopolysaccharide/colanic/teichoic acid biosynthesis glycosyltransferase
MYTEREKEILNVKPGITDWASVVHFKQFVYFTQSDDPDREYLEKIRPLKIELQLYYCNRQCLKEDMKILIFTVFKMIYRREELPVDIRTFITKFDERSNE